MEVFFAHVAHAAGHYTHQKLVLYSWRIFIDLDEAEKAKYCNPTEALTPLYYSCHLLLLRPGE